MSISSMTTLAVARNLRAPTKADVGSKTTEAAGHNEAAGVTTILAKTLPVGVVTAYTAFVAIVSESITRPTVKHPHPDQHLTLRLIALVVMVLMAVGLTYADYRRKAGGAARTPWLEMLAIFVAAAAWGSGIPDSPLLAAIHDRTTGEITAGLVAFVGVAINAVLSSLLKKRA